MSTISPLDLHKLTPSDSDENLPESGLEPPLHFLLAPLLSKGEGDFFPPHRAGLRAFALCYSVELFAAWVPQPSPCCAAASVAGACNALLGRTRSDTSALNHTHVLRALATNLEATVSKKRARFERLLGAEIQPLLERLDAELAATGQSLLAARRSAAPTVPQLLRMVDSIAKREIGGTEAVFDRLRELMVEDASARTAAAARRKHSVGEAEIGIGGSAAAEAAVQSLPPPVAEEPSDLGDDAAAVATAGTSMPFSAPGDTGTAAVAMVASGASGAAGMAATGDSGDFSDRTRGRSCEKDDGSESRGDDATNAGDDDGKNTVGVVWASSGAVHVTAPSRTRWLWRKDLGELLKRIGGVAQLTAEKPSTAPIGNCGLLEAVRRLSETGAFDAATMKAGATMAPPAATEALSAAGAGTTPVPVAISGRLFMGRGRSTSAAAGVDVVLSRNDDKKVRGRGGQGS
ncbi:unnamed protein product [Phaeothamnion confervicola]